MLTLCVPASAEKNFVPHMSEPAPMEIPREAISFTIDELSYVVVEGFAHVIQCSMAASGTVVIPDIAGVYPVVGIDNMAFAGCTEITEIVIPDTVTTIGMGAFQGCTSLEKAALPQGLIYLGFDVFRDTLIMEQNTKDGLTYVDRWLAYVDEGYTGKLKLPNGTVGVAQAAAFFCPNITSVFLPIRLKYVCDSAFAACESLNKVVFMGSAPFLPDLSQLSADILAENTLTAYYPEDDPSWTADVISSLKGEIVWEAARFVDLLEGNWYDSYCNQAADLKLMSGVGENHFQPDHLTDRAMFVQILHNIAGKPAPTISNPFTDVPDDQWYTNAILWALENGITGGTSPTTFEPSGLVTREQVALFLYSYCGKPQVTGDLSQFADADTVDSWAVDAMIWATQNSLISGSPEIDGKLYLKPLDTATRAHTATIMVGFYNKQASLLPPSSVG